MSQDFFENEQNDPQEEKLPTTEYKDIWGEDLSYLAQPEAQTAKKSFFKFNFITIIILAVIILCSLAYISTLVLGKGWLSNRFFSHNNVNIVIPIQDKPRLDEKYFDEATGKYTTEGIAKQVSPSVVSIEIYEQGVAFTPSSQGSGIILTENGYIITNAHVVANATRGIKVVLDNKEQYEAQVIGSDTKTDLAVIKISAKGLAAAKFGNSDELEIGEQIVAIGSPAGLFGSLTRGVVSGLNRMIKTEANNIEMNCIQIDAAINPGNSGGALVNMYGQVVGINSSKFLDSNYDGIGFAISFNAAKPILEKLIADGYIKDRVRIGIIFYEISEETAKQNNTKPGLFIKEIDPSCDVASSGLKQNDVITSINGQPVTSRADVDAILKGKKPGDTISASVFRQDLSGASKTLDIIFKLMEDTTTKIDTSSSTSSTN